MSPKFNVSYIGFFFFFVICHPLEENIDIRYIQSHVALREDEQSSLGKKEHINDKRWLLHVLYLD